MSTTAAPARHVCDRCGRKQPADRMVYSTHTRRRYCRDFNACDRRTKRNGRGVS